ncbi:S41 family peptidase [Hoylesella marshii]|uniref:S41 family peptidase n=1 Tax=Hoylesella marshii TaxID=189722 RepID=UPI0028D0B827|nr:S41 family peptidase [Hoylesella marshii]
MKKGLLSIILLLPALLGGAQQKKDHHFDVAKNIETFNAIYKNLDLMYVDTLDASEVIGTGINAMLRSLDPYTEYYPEDKAKDLKLMITGKYAGIGALIKYNMAIQRVVIDQPYANMPAAEAGLKKGDIILSIDDTVMTDKDATVVSSRLRGNPGTSFILKIQRPSTGKRMQFKITRKAIQMPAVPYYGLQENHIGYIQLNSFTEDCSKDVRRAFLDLKRQGMKGLVLDLRENGGGSLSEAVSIVNLFVPKGLSLVTTKGKLKRANRTYTTTAEPIDTVMPVVVLVNGGSASSSEVTCGSLQDLDRAVVLGTRTYGKGLVQIPVDLPYNGTLKLTTGHYYIPSGRCIQAINYKHANGGYKEHIPDSLTRVFHTANGREVRDGGGIKPDVEIMPDSLPNIAFYLASAGRDSTEVLFNYELDYIAAHPTIAPPAQFALSDADYADFKRRVLQSRFTYDRESEKYLKNLVKLARFEGYYDDAKAEFENLEKKLSHNIAKDLDINREKLKQLIAADIVAAYYYQAGTIENGLKYDNQMKEAVRLLLNPAEYKKILNGK